MEEGDSPSDKFEFYPLWWFLGGYCLQGLGKTMVQLLEDRKLDYLDERGYSKDGNNGYAICSTPTSRKMGGDGDNGT